MISQSTLKLIDWSIIAQKIAEFSFLDQSKNKFFNLSVIKNDQLVAQLERTQTFIDKLNFNYQHYDSLFTDLPSNFELDLIKVDIAKSRFLELNQLSIVSLCIENALRFSELAVNSSQHHKSAYTFITNVRKIIDRKNNIDFTQLEGIRELHDEIKNIENKIRNILKEKIADPFFSNHLQYNNWDMVYDRYVLPIKSDSYQYKMGNIIFRSDSKKTLYVELTETRLLSEKRIELNSQISYLIQSHTNKCNHLLQNNRSYILELFDYLSNIDLELTRAKFAIHLGLNKPQVATAPTLKLLSFSHPLIFNAVKNDFELNDKSGLLISGPNMGGKTACLKAITICIVFMKFGFYVPCNYAEIFPFDEVIYFGEAEQEIINGQSSFSAECTEYLNALYQSKVKNCIFVFDEIFNTTSSEEASSLALTIFDFIRENNGFILASTHHQTLKTFVHQQDKLISAHVGFDAVSNEPSYKLNVNSPGVSNALNIFNKILSNFNFQFDFFNRAKSRMEKSELHYEALLQQVSQKINKLELEIKATKQLKQQLQNQKNAMQSSLNIEKDKNIKLFINELKIEKDNIVNQLKNQSSTQKIEAIVDQVIKSKTLSPAPSIFTNKPTINSLDINTISVDDYLYHVQLKLDLKVLSIDKKRKLVTVSKNNLKMTQPLCNFTSKKSAPQPNVVVNFQSSKPSILLDVRGLKLDECINLFEKAISDLYYNNIPFLEVIHGHGDGILKNWIRNYIEKDNSIKMLPNSDGNDGSTLIALN
jgi:DNA mismatch repair protein MutS2